MRTSTQTACGLEGRRARRLLLIGPSLLVFAATACDQGMPEASPEERVAEMVSGIDPSLLEQPTLAAGAGVLAGPPDDEGVLAGAPVDAAPVERMAHDVAVWSVRSDAADAVDAIPIGPDVLVATTYRDGWGLELWRAPVADSPARVAATQRHHSHHAEAPVLVGPRSDGDGPWAGLILWLQDGTLLAQSVSVDGDALTVGEARVAFMATETHALLGGPAAVEGDTHGGDGYLVCVQEDRRGVLCGFMNRAGEVEGWEVIGKLGGYAPRALQVVPQGFVGLASRCKSEPSCHQVHLVTLHLDPAGRLVRRRGARGLAHVQGGRPIITAPHAEGLFVSARRVRGQHATAWHVGHHAVDEQRGRFDRLVGSVSLRMSGQDLDETWLLEESPLVMRAGFPVSLVRPLRWSPVHGREEPASWPRAINAALPGQPGQRVIGQHGLIALLPPHRAEGVELTFLRLSPNAEAPSEPRPAHPPERRRRAPRRAR